MKILLQTSLTIHFSGKQYTDYYYHYFDSAILLNRRYCNGAFCLRVEKCTRVLSWVFKIIFILSIYRCIRRTIAATREMVLKTSSLATTCIWIGSEFDWITVLGQNENLLQSFEVCLCQWLLLNLDRRHTGTSSSDDNYMMDNFITHDEMDLCSACLKCGNIGGV